MLHLLPILSFIFLFATCRTVLRDYKLLLAAFMFVCSFFIFVNFIYLPVQIALRRQQTCVYNFVSVAQWIAHQTSNLGVVGSSPTIDALFATTTLTSWGD